MNADAKMMHGRDWRGEDLAGWILSEKLHGCRAYWDGAVLWSRGGCAIDAPAAWRAELPAGIALDVEVYAGVGRFNAAQAATVYGRFTDGVRLLVFDADLPGEFPQRLAALHAALEGARHVLPVACRPARATACALTWLRRIRAAGGEGVMARHPQNVYAPGRTDQLLKLTVQFNLNRRHQPYENRPRSH